jgi:tetratricopeptide (TPR) repeat protein
VGIGDAYKQMKDFRDSENAYIMAMGLNPDDSIVPFALGQLYAYFQRPEKAIPEYEAALRIKPDYPLAKAALISAMNDAKRYDESIQTAIAFLKETPNDSNIQEQLAFAYSGEKNYPMALKTYQSVINADPKNPTSWGNYGWLEYLAGNIKDAIGFSLKALSLNPKLAYVKYNLGLYYAVSGNESMAIQTYNDGFTIASQDDTLNAMPDLKKAIKENPDNAILKKALSLLESLSKSYK